MTRLAVSCEVGAANEQFYYITAFGDGYLLRRRVPLSPGSQGIGQIAHRHEGAPVRDKWRDIHGERLTPGSIGIPADSKGIHDLLISQGCCRYRSKCFHLADTVVLLISDVDIAGGIHGHAGRLQFGAGGGFPVAGAAFISVPGHGGDSAIGMIQLVNKPAVSNIEVTGGIHGKAGRA